MSVGNGMVGILLAAGSGTRFGGDKGLARLPDGTPMALRSAQNLSQIADEVLCVVRPEDEWLRGVLNKASFKTVICHDADEGMGASLRAGVAASTQAYGWVIALADMPVIREKTYLKMIFKLSAEHIVMPEFQGKSGHPVWFPMQYQDDLLALKGDQGAKGIIQKYAEQIRRFTVMDPGVIQDFDTQASFEDYFSEGVPSLMDLLGRS